MVYISVSEFTVFVNNYFRFQFLYDKVTGSVEAASKEVDGKKGEEEEEDQKFDVDEKKEKKRKKIGFRDRRVMVTVRRVLM